MAIGTYIDTVKKAGTWLGNALQQAGNNGAVTQAINYPGRSRTTEEFNATNGNADPNNFGFQYNDSGQYDPVERFPREEMPEEMSWAQAYELAGNRTNPTYDALRGRQETQSSANREYLPQLMAAKYGMSGTKGGRIAGQITKSVQAEGQGINQIEGERDQATNELATSIQANDWAKAMDLWKTKEASRQADEARALQEKQFDQTKSDSDFNKKMSWAEYSLKLQGYNDSQIQQMFENGMAEKELGLKEGELKYNQMDTDRKFEYGKTRDAVGDSQWLAQFNKPTGGGGGSSSSGGLTPLQLLNYSQEEEKSARDYATKMAEIDSRAAGGGWSSYVDENGQTQWAENTPEQIWDAYYQKYLNGQQ